MDSRYRLERFDNESPPPAQVLAELHLELLPTSPVAQLGNRFLRSYYYTSLPRQGRVFGLVAYVTGQPAGFIAATNNSPHSIHAALEGRFATALGAVMRSVLSKPRRLDALWEIVRVMSSRSSGGSRERIGEILSMGVRWQYRDAAFINESGLHIAHDLTEGAVSQLKANGTKHMLVVIDADNTAAQLLYRSLGWELVRSSVPGWRTPSVEFALEA